MQLEFTDDEAAHLETLDDDSLYNVLQSVRIDLFEAESDVEHVNEKRVSYLYRKLEAIQLILEERGLNAHKQF